MQQWETRSESKKSDETVSDLCYRLGKDGWEPWGILVPGGVGAGTYIYFKRPISTLKT